MAGLCRFCKTFCHIKWTKTTLVICAIPFVLIFVIINLTLILMDGNEGAIITRTLVCAEIGKKICEEGGSAVDIVIAIMFCENVHFPLEVGIGGGFSAVMFMNGRFTSIIATPKAPSNISAILKVEGKPSGVQRGGVPGELLGYWEMHQKYGLLSWKRLLEPSIELFNTTFPLNENRINDIEGSIIGNQLNNSAFRMPVFATTLQKIADKGADVFYHGEIGRAFIEDVQAAGGYITFDDLENYRVSWNRDLVKFSLPNGLKGYTTPLPSSGAIVALVMNIIKPYVNISLPVFWHRTVEAMKHASGMGWRLGDVENENVPEYRKMIMKTYRNMIDPVFARSIRDKIFDDRIFKNFSYYGVQYRPDLEEGSVQLCVISPNGDAISLISSLIWSGQTYFLSSKTGIILNNQIRRSHRHHSNLPLASIDHLQPGKRIMSSHAPVIVVSTKTFSPFFVTSAAGGDHIPFQIVTSIINYCMLRKDAFIVADSGFLHPRLDQHFVEYGGDVSNEILDYLEKVGNKIISFEESLKHSLIACIANAHSLPVPRISRKNKGSGAALLTQELMMKVFYFMVIIFICLVVIFTITVDYCKFVENQNFEGD